MLLCPALLLRFRAFVTTGSLSPVRCDLLRAMLTVVVSLPARWFSWSFLLSSFPAAALQRVQDRDRGHSHPPLCQQGSRLWCVNTSRTSRISRTSRVLTHCTSVSFPPFTFAFCVSIPSFYILFHSVWVYWVTVLEPERVVVHAVMAGSAVVIFSFTNPSGACATASQVIQIFTSSHRPVQIITSSHHPNHPNDQMIK